MIDLTSLVFPLRFVYCPHSNIISKCSRALCSVEIWVSNPPPPLNDVADGARVPLVAGATNYDDYAQDKTGQYHGPHGDVPGQPWGTPGGTEACVDACLYR